MLLQLISGLFKKKKAVTPASSKETSETTRVKEARHEKPVATDLGSLVSRLDAEQRKRVKEGWKIFVYSPDYLTLNDERVKKNYPAVVKLLLATEAGFAAFETWYKGAEAWPDLVIDKCFIDTSFKLLTASPRSLVAYGTFVSGLASILGNDPLLRSTLEKASENALQIARVSPSLFDVFLKTYLALA